MSVRGAMDSHLRNPGEADVDGVLDHMIDVLRNLKDKVAEDTESREEALQDARAKLDEAQDKAQDAADAAAAATEAAAAALGALRRA